MNKTDLAGTALGVVMLVTGLVAWLAGLFWLRIITLLWLWNWYILPFGADMVSFWHAAGITLFVTFFTFKMAKSSELKERNDQIAVFVTPYTAALTILGLGYLFQLGM